MSICFLGAWMEEKNISACMQWTAMAAAICVSCLGASEAIPLRREL